MLVIVFIPFSKYNLLLDIPESNLNFKQKNQHLLQGADQIKLVKL